MDGRVVIAAANCDTYLLHRTAMMTACLCIADVDRGFG